MSRAKEDSTVEDYQSQAREFLRKRGITFSGHFITHDFHWEGDKERRDIWRLTLRRGSRRFSVRFGQSIYASQKGEAPTAYDLLACLTKSDPGTLADFCREFGYDEDSRRAEKTGKACVREWKKVEGFFTAAELEMLGEIQ